MERIAAEKQFAFWLTTQTNARGVPYKAHVANRYAACLRTEPFRLDIPLSPEERDIYRCRTLQNFDRLNRIFREAPNFQEIDRGSGHGTFSAGLFAYRRYMCYLGNGDVKMPVASAAFPMEEQTNMIPTKLLDTLRNTYPSGFRFEATSINLLSSASGIPVSEELQNSLRQIMFRREDDIFFLLDQVVDESTRSEIVEFADSFLQEYSCFEIPELYQMYRDHLALACIRNAEDFECFYKQITHRGVRCVGAPQFGNRIARYSGGNVWTTFGELAKKIAAHINNEHYGSCTEEDLHQEFCVFSRDLLGKVIRQFLADEFVRVEINDTICYQSFAALGLPENFSGILSDTLDRLEEIGLPPSQETLHTALSLDLSMNLKSEFSLPDWDTYRRLIKAYYKGNPPREWKNNIFSEVKD